MTDSVETVNAAAAAIVVAESRVQPSISVQKRRWGGCWSLYSCFGCQMSSKRVDHAVLVPEPVVHRNTIPTSENPNHSTPMSIPFVAPPSSPASFLRSDPSTAVQSPGGPINLASLSASSYSPSGPTNVFATGPYAYETQLVSPPIFSTFTTEPSTAAVTPPPESVQMTTPSSPEVPFAQLLTSSLNRARRNSGSSQKHGMSYYEFHQLYSGSPAGHLISPGSVNSTSGTSSPYPVKHPLLAFRIADASKLFESKNFVTTHKWGPRLGSGSLTPDGLWPASRDSLLLENQISELASLANSEHGSEAGEAIVDQRVSFELAGEDIPTCLEVKKTSMCSSQGDLVIPACVEMDEEEENKNCKHKHSSVSLGSVKEFKFDSADKDEGRGGPSNSWTFFPLIHPGVS
ncbi:hypothetical protein V2J09_022208 [Rumex salicifolius]